MTPGGEPLKPADEGRPVKGGQLAYVGRKKANGKHDPFFFEMTLEVTDVEFGDDMFVLTAADARKLVEPPVLMRIVVRPDGTQIAPGKSLSFGAHGVDQHGHEMQLVETSWTATGGQVDSRGAYRAADTPGEYVVTVTSDAVLGSARVWVGAKQDDKPDPSTPTQGQLRWSGDVPAQKWMQFYTKVLARYSNNGGLAVNVAVVISPEKGVSRQQADEVR